MGKSKGNFSCGKESGEEGFVQDRSLESIRNVDHMGTKPSLLVHPNLGYKVFTHEIEGYYAYFMEDFETSFFNFSKRMMDGG